VDSVLRIEVIDYAVARMEEALRKGYEKLNAELERMRQRKLQLEAELARLVNAIAEGQPSQSFMTAIGERERELQAITSKLIEPGPRSFAGNARRIANLCSPALNQDTRVNLASPKALILREQCLQNTSGRSRSNPPYRVENPCILLTAK
jgi:hypothetical protein